MANNENLKPNSERTPSERKALAKKAGIASGKARRKVKKIKEYLEIGLELAISDKQGNTYSRKEAGVIKLIERYVKGDPKAFDTVVELLGENPAKKLDVTTNQPSVAFEVKKDDIKNILTQINNLADE